MSTTARKARKRDHHALLFTLKAHVQGGGSTRTKFYRELKEATERTRYVSPRGSRKRRELPRVKNPSWFDRIRMGL